MSPLDVLAWIGVAIVAGAALVAVAVMVSAAIAGVLEATQNNDDK